MTTKIPHIVLLLVSAHSLNHLCWLDTPSHISTVMSTHTDTQTHKQQFDNFCTLLLRLESVRNFLSDSIWSDATVWMESQIQGKEMQEIKSEKRERSKWHLTNAEERGDMADEIVFFSYPGFYPFVSLWSERDLLLARRKLYSEHPPPALRRSFKDEQILLVANSVSDVHM